MDVVAYNAAYYIANRDRILERKKSLRAQIRPVARAWSDARYAVMKKRYYDGVVCCWCGGDNVVYHHADPSTKLYTPALTYRKSEQIMVDEFAKCVPLCRPCQSGIHTEGF